MDKAENILSLISVVISFFTLIIIYLAYKKIFFQQYRQKQIDAVLELVTNIQNNKCKLTFVFNGENFTENYFTLLELSMFKKYQQFDSLFILPNSSFTKNIQNSFCNPYLPNSISNVLKKFTSKYSKMNSWSELTSNKKIIILGSESNNDIIEIHKNQFLMFVDTSLNNSFEMFIRKLNELVQLNKEWLKKNGIKDINFNTVNINELKGEKVSVL